MLATVAGRGLIAVGGLAVLFSGFELWGTTILEARSQHALRRDFAAQLETQNSAPANPVTPVDPALPAPGDAIARLKIPSIGVDRVVVEGVGVGELRQGPGHYPGTAIPGSAIGNVGIAGHRTTYGAPFSRLDELVAGSPIDVRTSGGSFRYRVTKVRVVSPDRVDVLATTSTPTLTLTTCHPRFSSRERLVITAVLESTPSTDIPADPSPSERSSSTATAPPGEGGGARASLGGLLLAGLPAGTVAAAWLLAVHRWHGRGVLVAGPLPFLVALVPFFVALESSLPANF